MHGSSLSNAALSDSSPIKCMSPCSFAAPTALVKASAPAQSCAPLSGSDSSYLACTTHAVCIQQRLEQRIGIGKLGRWAYRPSEVEPTINKSLG